MEKIIQYLIVIIVVVGLLVSGIYIFFYQMKKDSYTSEYSYEVHIDTENVVTNVTVIVPLPVYSNEPFLGDDITSGKAHVPEDWRCSLVDSNGTTMLKIEIDRIEPNSYEHLRANQTSQDSIDTKSPQDDEPLLQPKYNMSETEYGQPHPEEWDDRLKAYNYTTLVFLSYEGSNESEIRVSIRLSGSNTWWTLGWSGNEYWDNVSIEAKNGEKGWFIAEGKLVEGHGNY
ncbi:MAG: hypothetical protein R6U61_04085 [Thermoplasmata archaeon]